MKKLWCKVFGHKLHKQALSDEMGIPYQYCERCLCFVKDAEYEERNRQFMAQLKEWEDRSGGPRGQ